MIREGSAAAEEEGALVLFCACTPTASKSRSSRVHILERLVMVEGQPLSRLLCASFGLRSQFAEPDVRRGSAEEDVPL